MEIRELRCFVEVARCKSFTAAASRLFVTQPTLSRTIAGLEEEIGHRLFDRTTHRISLTAKGEYLYHRAQSIIELLERTKLEAQSSDALQGEITIAAGEAPSIAIVADTIAAFQERNPHVRFHLLSAAYAEAGEMLRSGLADFGVFMLPADLDGLASLPLPRPNHWGVLTRRDGPLAGKTFAEPADLRGLPLYIPRRENYRGYFAGWLGVSLGSLDLRGTYNLLWNASLVVRAGGSALCLEGIVTGDNSVMFLPLRPEMRQGSVFVWPESRPKRVVTELFLRELSDNCSAAIKSAGEQRGVL